MIKKVLFVTLLFASGIGWYFFSKAVADDKGSFNLAPEKNSLSSLGKSHDPKMGGSRGEDFEFADTELKMALSQLAAREAISSLAAFEERIEDIKNEFKGGEEMYYEILVLFRDSKVIPSDLVKYLEACEDEKLVVNGKNGLSLRFSDSRLNSLSEVGDIVALQNSLIGKDILKKGMTFYVYSTGDANVVSRMEEVRQSFFDRGLSDSFTEAMLLRIGGEGDSAGRVKDFFAVFGELLKAENASFSAKLFSSWEGSEAIGALEVLADSLEDFDPQSVWMLSRNALSYSPQKASELLNLENEGVKAALLESYLLSGDLERAKMEFSATDFEDEEIRKKVKWHLWDMQQKTVRREMKQNPLDTVTSLLNGTSKYDQNFLETAVTHWIEKDPEQAADWTEANIDQMAHGPRQYVAASYAKEAAALGDMATARQWANLIQDEETLGRINGIIEKAEQAASN